MAELTRNERIRKALIPEGYPDPKRLPLGQLVRAKRGTYMDQEDLGQLFSARVLVEEKMDGKSERFESDRFIVFAEDLRSVHSLHYRIPARFAVFDVFDAQRMLFLDREGKADIVRSLRKGVVTIAGRQPFDFFLVPLVSEGVYALEQIPQLIGLSACAFDKKTNGRVPMEGLVVKKARELFLAEFVAGKLVREEFEEGITVHYAKKPSEKNIIDPSVLLDDLHS